MLILFALLFCLSVPGSLQAATYYVAPTGSNSTTCTQAQTPSTPKQTISAGISCLAPGDTLMLKTGTYAERITSVVAGISTSQRTVIRSAPGETATLRPSNAGTSVIEIHNPGVNVFLEFRDLVIDAINVSNTGVKVEANFIRFDGGEVKNAGMVGSGGHNCFLVGGTGNEFRNLHVHSCGYLFAGPGPGYAFYVHRANGTLIENNQMHDIGGWCIQVYNEGTMLPQNTVIRNNRIYDCNVTDIKTADNGAILVYFGPNNQVYNNLIYGRSKLSSTGIRVRGTSPKIYNNTIYNTTHRGIRLQNSTDAVVKNNIMFQTGGVGVDTSLGGNGNLTQSNNLISNPVFLSPSAGDFRLQSTSPAINAGAAIPEITVDFAGIARPQGCCYDIGAYEYTTTPAPLSQPTKLFVTP